MNGTYRKTGLRECRRLTIISLSGQLDDLNCSTHAIFQMSNINLTYSIVAVASESTSRVMVAVPLLYVFMTHYLFHLLRMIKGTKENTERINDLGRRLFLYGVVVLFSVNFIQSTVVGAVLSWAILITMIISHCFVFLKETGQKYHNICLLIYYSLLLAWFACVLYNYYAGLYS